MSDTSLHTAPHLIASPKYQGHVGEEQLDMGDWYFKCWSIVKAEKLKYKKSAADVWDLLACALPIWPQVSMVPFLTKKKKKEST